jgi:hypothetical protein
MPGHLPSRLTGRPAGVVFLISEFDAIAPLRHFLDIKRSTDRIIEIVNDDPDVTANVQ